MKLFIITTQNAYEKKTALIKAYTEKSAIKIMNKDDEDTIGAEIEVNEFLPDNLEPGEVFNLAYESLV